MEARPVAARIDPRAKILLAAFCILTAALTPKDRFERLLVLLVIESAVAAALSFAGILNIRRFLVITAAGAAASLLFCSFAAFRPGHLLFSIAPGFDLSAEGAALALGLFLASACSATAVALASATTGAAEARRALRALAFPPSIPTLLTIGARQIQILQFEARRTARAAALRGAKERGYLAFLAVSGNASNIMIRGIERGARLDRALLLRGFHGSFPDPPLPAISAINLFYIFGGAALFCILLFL